MRNRADVVRILLITALAGGVIEKDWILLEQIAEDEGIFDILSWAEMDETEDNIIFFLSEKNIKMLREKHPY